MITTKSLVIAAALLGAVACSSTGDVAEPGSSGSSGATADSGSTPVEAGPINGCTTFEDRTADDADRTIVWTRRVGKVCLKIKKGQTVTWAPTEANFAAHPLAPSGGASPNPITAPAPTAAPYVATVATAGTFGYVCTFHFDMTGAIQVVE